MRTIREVMDIKIVDFDLPVRCVNCMNNMNIKTLSELTSHSQEEIGKMRNMGKKSLEELNKKLGELELTYNMDDRAWLDWGMKHIQVIKAL